MVARTNLDKKQYMVRRCICGKGPKYYNPEEVDRSRIGWAVGTTAIVAIGVGWVTLDTKRVDITVLILGVIATILIALSIKNMLNGHKILCSLWQALVSILRFLSAGPVQGP
jgi:hypothetical protein